MKEDEYKRRFIEDSDVFINEGNFLDEVAKSKKNGNKERKIEKTMH